MPTLRPSRARLAHVAAVLAASAPVAVRAGPEGALTWQAPAEGCPSQHEVSERLRAHAGPDGEVPAGVRVRVERVAEGGFRARIAAPEGERVIEGESCSALADATVAVIALLAGPKKAGEAEGRAPVAPADSSRRTPIYVHFGAGLWGGTAEMPAPALGPAVQGGVRWGRFRAEVGAAFWPRRERELQAEPRVGGRVGLTSFMAQACIAPYDGALRVEGCGGGELGTITAEGFGADGVSEKRRAWYAAQAGVGAAWSPWPHLMLRAQGGALLPLTHPRFLIEGAGEVHRPPSVGARLFLGVDTFF